MIKRIYLKACGAKSFNRTFLYICLFFVLLFLCSPIPLQAQEAKVDSLLILLVRSKEDTSKVIILNEVGREMESKGNYESALKYATEAKALAVKIAFKKGVALSCNIIGLANYGLGNFSEALRNYTESLKVWGELTNRRGIADAYNNIGLIYLDQGNYPEALNNYLQALKIYESLSNSKSSKKRIGSVYINIGSIYLYQVNYPEAIKSYTLALKILEEIEDQKGMADAYSNIGATHYLQLNYDEALKNYLQSLQLKEGIGDQQGIADSYINIGLVNHDQGSYEDALKNYFTALKIHEESGNKDGMAAAYTSIGNTFTKQKKFAEAKKYLTLALQISKDMGAKDNLKECYSGLAQLSEAAGDDKAAYSYFKLYSEIKDSLLNRESNKQIAEMRTKYETEKKDNEIILLNSENKLKEAEVKKQKVIKYAAFLFAALVMLMGVVFFKSVRIKNKAEQIVQRNEIRKRIALDLHDEIGAGLTSITMICEQGKIKAKNLQSDSQVFFEKISKQSQGVSEKLGEVVWATNPENDNLTSVISYMRNYVSKYLENSAISFSLKLPEVIPSFNLEPDVGRNLFFVMKEALNNCIKHSEASRVEITFRIENKNYYFQISDNGKGIDYSALPPHHNGLGNMRKRIENINGKFEIISGNGKGTMIEISGNLISKPV